MPTALFADIHANRQAFEACLADAARRGAESIVLMVLGTSWAPAVSFGLLLLVLGIRPQGLFGR